MELIQNIFDQQDEMAPKKLENITPEQVTELNSKTYERVRERVPTHLL